MLSRSGQLVSGGWAIETYWHDWFAWGRTFGKDFRVGPLRLLFGTSNHGESCGGNCLLLYTPFNYGKCKGGSCHACYHDCQKEIAYASEHGYTHECWRTQEMAR